MAGFLVMMPVLLLHLEQQLMVPLGKLVPVAHPRPRMVVVLLLLKGLHLTRKPSRRWKTVHVRQRQQEIRQVQPHLPQWR